jgi:NAD(P)-dependent dehydrogenase (short-subunit alcohol dehydrogenase family)
MTKKTLLVFDKATAIITGGASGIGKALGEELARRGSQVVLADLQIDRAEEIATQIKASGGKAKAAKLDVTDFAAVEQLVQETAMRTGRIDYIFNNAGIAIGGTVKNYTIEDWNYILDINLRGVINGVQAVYNLMVSQGFGHIVNTASLAGLLPAPGSVSYSATKHAIVGLSKSLRAEAAIHGIQVSVLCPGVIRTPILEKGGKYGRILKGISDKEIQLKQEMFEKYNPMSANLFAKEALDRVAKNEAIIVLPSRWKWFWRLHRLFPSLGILLAQGSFENKQSVLKSSEK